MLRYMILLLSFFIINPGISFGETILLEEIEVKAKKETETESLEVREIRESNARDAGEALEDVPSINKIRKGAIGNDVILRGYKRDDVNVLIDGMRIHGACLNRMDPPAFHLDFAEVDKIDVEKGAFDVKHPGSLGGMVNIKTKSPKKGFHGEVNLGYASFENFTSSANASYGADRYSFLAGVAYKESEAYRDGDDDRFTEVYSDSAANRYKPQHEDGTAYEMLTGWTKFSIKPSYSQNMEISYSRQEGDDTMYPYLFMDSIKNDTDRLSMDYDIKNFAGSGNDLKFQVYYNYIEHDMSDERRCSSQTDKTSCTGDMQRRYSMLSEARSYTTGGKIESKLDLMGETYIGVDFYLRNWNVRNTMFKQMMSMYQTQITMPDVDTTNVGIYFEQKNNLTDRLTLSYGLRADRTNMDTGENRDAVFQQYFNTVDTDQTDTYGSGNIKLDYKFTDSFSSFIGFGHTVRIPDPQERYMSFERMGTMEKPDRVGNPDLDEVKNNELDWGVKYKAGAVLLKGQVFYSNIEDYIVLRNIYNGSDYAMSYKNVNATMYGGEASARVAFPRDFYFLPNDLYLLSSISYTRGKNDTDDTDLHEIPPFRGSIALRYDNGKYFGEIEGEFADEQTRVDEQLDEEETSGWGIANFKAGYEYKKIKLFAGVSNLFDKKYYEHLSYFRHPFSSGVKVPEPGRTLYVNLQYTF